MVLKCPAWNAVTGIHFLHNERLPACFFFLTPNGEHFWPSLGCDYPLCCPQILVTILRLSQPASQENDHITCMTTPIYTAQKAELCSDVSEESYSCITQNIKTDISLAAKEMIDCRACRLRVCQACKGGFTKHLVKPMDRPAHTAGFQQSVWLTSCWCHHCPCGKGMAALKLLTHTLPFP